MAGAEILHQRGDGKAVDVSLVAIAVDGEVDDGKEGVGVNVLVFAHLFDGLVAKSQIDAKRAKALKDIVVVAYDGYQLVVGLIHFLIFHTNLLLL